MHVGDHVAAVDDERRALRHSQRDMEDGAVLGRVDPVAAEHRLRALRETGLARELEQEAQRLVGDAVLRVVEIDACALGREPLAAGRVVGEQVAQMEPADVGDMPFEGCPRGPLAERRDHPAGRPDGRPGNEERTPSCVECLAQRSWIS